MVVFATSVFIQSLAFCQSQVTTAQAFDLNTVTLWGNQAALLDRNADQGRTAVHYRFNYSSPYPSITFHFASPLDWSSKYAVGMTVYNPGTTALHAFGVLQTASGSSSYSASNNFTLQPGQRLHLEWVLSTANLGSGSGFRMPTLPPPSATPVSVMSNSPSIVARTYSNGVTGITIGSFDTGSRDIVASEPTTYALDLSQPLIDAYGQLRFENYSGKVSSDSDIATAEQAELNDLNANPAISEPWGTSNPSVGMSTLNPTNWTIEQANGKWWFVNPSGRRLWAMGIDSLGEDLGSSYGTVVQGRQSIFENLPATNDPNFGQFYGTSNGQTTYDHIAANLYRRWGANWRSTQYDRWIQRLPSWGFNCLGCWNFSNSMRGRGLSFGEVVFGARSGYAFRGAPTVAVPSEAGSALLEDPFWSGWVQYWQTGTANFLKSLPANVQSDIGNQVLCLFSDNEIAWGSNSSSANDPNRYRIGYSTLRSPAGTPAKDALIAWLQQTANRGPGYTGIAQLDSAWGLTGSAAYTAFNDGSSTCLRNMTTAVTTFTPTMRNDMANFAYYWAKTYAQGVKTGMQAAMGNVLYAGTKDVPSWTPPEIVQGLDAPGGVDLHSYDIYGDILSGSLDTSLCDSTTKPWILAEIAFGGGSTGHPSMSYCSTGVDAGTSAKCFRLALEQLLNDPQCVGMLYFGGTAQPIGGRTLDGENGSFNITDVAGTPVAEMRAEFRAILPYLYNVRMGGGTFANYTTAPY